MSTITIGLDIAKRVFQVHGVDATGQVVIRKKLRRSEVFEFFKELPPSLIGMEACGTAHHRGRELTALGHDVRLMPAGYVKPYVKRGKNDAVDAEAICEAVTRPTMRFVEIKSAEQQSVLMLHRTRELLVRQRTALINSLRGQLAEFGLIAPQGVWRIPQLHALAQGATSSVLPDAMRACVELIMDQIEDLQMRIGTIGKAILACHRASKMSQRLQTIPGIGVITATAIAATVADANVFKSGRHFAAWIDHVRGQDDGMEEPGAAGLSAAHACRRCADREQLSRRHQYPSGAPGVGSAVRRDGRQGHGEPDVAQGQKRLGCLEQPLAGWRADRAPDPRRHGRSGAARPQGDLDLVACCAWRARRRPKSAARDQEHGR